MENVIPLRGKNILGSALSPCCHKPKTGYYRDGFCFVGSDDAGNHSVCAIMTKEFLEFSVAQGNDLVTPFPEAGFPGLKPGDRWCLCAARWKQAYEAGVAPPIAPESTSSAALDVVPLNIIEKFILN